MICSGAAVAGRRHCDTEMARGPEPAAHQNHIMIKRRDLLLSLGATTLAACAPLPTARQLGALEVADITVRTQMRGNLLMPDFVGLSFESELLADSAWFNGGNAVLQHLVRNLGSEGVLRFGGNSSDTAFWQREPGALPAGFSHAVTPADIDRLAAFAEACGWRVVYGINLGRGDPQRAADEAAYVAQRLGSRLDALQIGNEPDLYERRGLRPGGYSADAFVKEWEVVAAAIRARAGDVPLAGPDVAYRPEWLEAFARSGAGQARFLSAHYYPVGPAKDASVDIRALLASEELRAEQMKAPVDIAGRYFRPLRLTEANSCYDGGKPGVSDVAASALWAIDTSMGFCRDGWSGIYFHGGSRSVYSPIRRDASGNFVPQPLYYGLLLMAQAAPLTLVESTTRERPAYLRLFAGVTSQGHIRVFLVNPHQGNAVDVRIDANRPLQKGDVLQLRTPTLYSRDGLTLGGAGVAADGSWKWAQPEAAVLQGTSAFVTVAPAAAVLLTLD